MIKEAIVRTVGFAPNKDYIELTLSHELFDYGVFNSMNNKLYILDYSKQLNHSEFIDLTIVYDNAAGTINGQPIIASSGSSIWKYYKKTNNIDGINAIKIKFTDLNAQYINSSSMKFIFNFEIGNQGCSVCIDYTNFMRFMAKFKIEDITTFLSREDNIKNSIKYDFSKPGIITEFFGLTVNRNNIMQVVNSTEEAQLDI